MCIIKISLDTEFSRGFYLYSGDCFVWFNTSDIFHTQELLLSENADAFYITSPIFDPSVNHIMYDSVPGLLTGRTISHKDLLGVWVKFARLIFQKFPTEKYIDTLTL